MKRCPAFFLCAFFPVLAAFAPAPALAQSAAASAASLQVLRLAPQLVAFAGSESNFQSLVNGLAGGFPVTLVTPTADGFTQTVTFTPAGTLSAAQVAQTLEAARQQLISRGIANPTAQQIGVTLAGGTLPTVSGDVQVAGLVPVTASTASAANAENATTGASVPTAAATPSGSGLVVQIVPSATATTTTSAGAPIRFTSDTPRLGNVSDSPIPPASALPSTASTAGAASGAATTTAGQAAGPNGPPSPAALMQNRR